MTFPEASMRRTLIVLTAAMAWSAPLPAQDPDPDTRQRVDSVFAPFNRTDGPGCAVGVVQDGRLTHARGYGMGNLDLGVPLSPRSVFYLASVSKQFTAAAVLVAAHEGHLSLDDEVRAHIPELADYGAPLTVRHLLHHTSGVRDYLTLMALAGIPYEDILTDEAMLGLIARQEALNFEPGSDYLYSNTGYVLLAEIVERATGRSLREYAHEKIFRPLRMRSTHFHDEADEVVPGRVFSYAAGEDGWRTSYLMNFDKVGDGGLYSSVEDLARWDAAFYDDRLGVPDFAERMHTRGVLTGGDTIGYARGLAVGERGGLRRIAHGGGLMAFRTMIARYPDEHTTVITLCNAGTANSGRLSATVEDILLEDAYTEPVETAGSGGPEEPEEEPEPVVVPPDVLAELAGRYHSRELDADWVLLAEEGELRIVHPRGDTLALEPRSETVFVSPRGLELSFQREDGRVTGFVLAAGRVRGIRFERVP